MSTRDRLLIVEDEAIIAMGISDQLSAHGFEIVGIAASGEQAIELARSHSPDLVLMDLRLRGAMDGVEVAARIHSELGIPSVFLSAYADDETLSRVKPLEPMAYVTKPFDGRSLVVTLQLALHRHRAESARREAEQERRRVEARMLAILDHTHDAIISTDERGEIIVFNKGAERIFGFSAEEAVGQPVELLVPEESRERHDVLRDLFMQSEEPELGQGRLRLVKGRRKDGTSFPADIALSRVLTPDQVCFTACVHDLTERMDLERKFLHAQKMEGVGRVAASVAHDFNNILSAILGNTYLIGIGASSAEAVQDIRTVIDRGASLTRQLLAFSRPVPFAHRRFELSDPLRPLCRLLRRVLREDIRFEVSITEEPLCVEADPGLLDQIVMNLVLNARDALSRGGTIRLRVERLELGACEREPGVALPAARCASIQVGDDGPGIPDDDLEKIFEPFFTTKHAGVGTGLGLSTARSILHDLGGSICARNGPDGGALFEVLLPLAEGPATWSSSPPTIQPPRGASETILLIEDDEELVRSVSACLVAAGYNVLPARSMREAYSLSRSEAAGCDVVLADLCLPDARGAQLVELLSAHYGDCPTVLMTGHREHFDGGAFQRQLPILEKPVAPELLMSTIRNALDRSACRTPGDPGHG